MRYHWHGPIVSKMMEVVRVVLLLELSRPVMEKANVGIVGWQWVVKCSFKNVVMIHISNPSIGSDYYIIGNKKRCLLTTTNYCG